MGDLLTKCLEPLISCVDDSVLGEYKVLVKFNQTREELSTQWKELDAMREDIERDISVKETMYDDCTHKVEAWISSVNGLKDKVEKFKKEFAGRPTCSQGCSLRPLCSRLRLSHDVASLCKEVTELKSQRNDLGDLVSQVSRTSFPGPTELELIGGKETLSEVRGCLTGGDKGIIGLYGMGGIGKTTLLKKIQQEFSSPGGGFDMVIRIDRPDCKDTKKLCKDICYHLDLHLPQGSSEQPVKKEWSSEHLQKRLAKITFLFLLDDVLQHFKLEDIGIPTPAPDSKSRIVLASRSRSVCINMNAKVIKVNLLNEKEARRLFNKSAKGNNALSNRRLQHHIKGIISECGGLPLALVIVGGAMATQHTPDLWKAAENQLKNSPEDITGMADQVYKKLLMFSYENLSGNSQQCFLYCCLFPEKRDIVVEQLIEYWIGEGLLDDKEDAYPKKRIDGKEDENIKISRARNRGHKIINDLIATCLLEPCTIAATKVRMHDVVRDAGLWIAENPDMGFSKEKSNMVHAVLRSSQKSIADEQWKVARRISLLQGDSPHRITLPEIPKCNNLSTLLISGNTSIEKIPANFFQYMSTIHVLDLSGTSIVQLPVGISMLSQLQYLNLSDTPITSLPKQVGSLRKLRQLNLSSTSSLSTVPDKAISNLLWALDLLHSSYDSWGQKTEVSLGKLKLQELGLSIRKDRTLDNFLNSSVLESTVSLCLWGFEVSTPEMQSMDFQKMKILRELRIGELKGLMELKFHPVQNSTMEILKLFNLPDVYIILEPVPKDNWRLNLRHLDISGCHNLEDVTWIQYLYGLEKISLRHCDGLKYVLTSNDSNEGEQDPDLEVVKEIILQDLRNLESIYVQPLKLYCLESLTVDKCPNLKKLPFHKDRANKTREIFVITEWWDGFEWEEPMLESKFHSHPKNQHPDSTTGVQH